MGPKSASRIAKKCQIRLEKKRLAAEATIRRKCEELEREMAAHWMCKIDLEKKWRTTMLKMKIPVYRQRIEVMWHTLDRAYDKKDGLINHLVYLRNIANFQYQRTIAGFCVVVDKTINNFLSDFENMQKKNDIDTAELLKFGREEITHYLEAHKKAEMHLKLLLYTSHNAADSLAWNTHGDNMVRKDEESSTFNEVRDTLSAVLEGAYCYMWEQYKTELRKYLSKTAENQKQLRLLRKKEQEMNNIIAAQAKKLIVYEKIIIRLRVDLLAYETGEKQAGFRDRRNRHRDACNRMKKNMNRGAKIDKKQLNTLVKASADAVDWIEAAYKKCEKILRMAAFCRKHETLREKVMPCGLKTPEEPIKTNIRMPPIEDPLITSSLTSTCGLAKLWQRISNAELSRRALYREKVLLERENAILERKLDKQNKENMSPEVNKCECAEPVPLKKSSTRPNAVEAALEMKKLVC